MAKINEGIIQHGGDINAKQVVVGRRAQASMTVHGTTAEPGDEADRRQLLALLEALGAQLQNAPKTQSIEAQALASQAQHMVQAAVAENPNPNFLSTIGANFKATAAFLKDTAPAAVAIAGKIAEITARLHGISF